MRRWRRYIVPRKDFEYSPLKAVKPGMEAHVMGPYYPQGSYTTKAKFETEGRYSSRFPGASSLA